MVLNKFKFLFSFLFIFSLGLLPAQAKTRPTAKEVYLYAKKLNKKGEHEKAFALLNKRFSLSSGRIPVAIISLAALAALEGGQVGIAEKIADTGLKKRFSWWQGFVKNPDRETMDLSSRLNKMHSGHLHLFWVAGRSKSLMYKDFFSKLSTAEKNRLKNETQAVYDVLVQSSFDPEKTEGFYGNISQRDTLEVKKVFNFQRRISVQSILWPDEFDYSFENGQVSSGEVLSQAACVGGSYSYENQLVQFILNGCFGFGTSRMDLSTGFYSDISTRVLILGAGVYGKMPNQRIDYGIDLSAFSRFYSLGKIASSPEPVSFSNQTSLLIAPSAKFNFGNFQFNLKVGKILGQKSSVWLPEIWIIEGSYKL